MSSENLHAPRNRLTIATLNHHQAVVSLIEELEAVDWYRQRADDCEDDSLKQILLHNMREEMEHASMILEWLRRSSPEWSEKFDTYLYTDVPITEVEEEATGRTNEGESGSAAGEAASGGTAKPSFRFTVGSLKREGDA